MSIGEKDARATAEPQTGVKRDITGRMLYLFILGDVLGAGIYALVGQIAGEVGGVTWAPMLVALALALLTAASYAELVTKYPHAGGSAVFAERAYKKPVVSFLVGYCMLAAGHLDLVIETELKPYDIAALIPIVTGAGGIVTTWEGKPAQSGGRIVAAGDPRVHEAALKRLNT